MAPLKERLTAKVDDLRARRPLADQTFRTFEHYAGVDGNAQAGAVTFFAFLSFFPILAVAFFVVGYLSKVYDLQRELARAIDNLLPGIVGDSSGQIPLSTFEEYAGAVGLIGLAGLLYSGLSWLSGMRNALHVMFRRQTSEQPNIVVAKARDVGTLVLLGAVLLFSVSLTGALSWVTRGILEMAQLEGSWLAVGLLWLVTSLLGIAATTVLLVAMVRLLARPQVASRALTQGALVGAVGFEALKLVANFLMAQTRAQPAFQAFGVALILLVWINYFSRLVMLSAAWAHTHPLSERLRALESEPFSTSTDGELFEPAPAAVVGEDPAEAPLPRERARTRRVRQSSAVGAGVAAAVAVAVGRRRWR